MKKSLLLLSLLAATSIAQAQVATVNGVEIPQSRMDEIVKALEAQQKQPVTDEVKTQIREQLITREIMLQEAQNRRIDKVAEVQKQIALATEEIMVNGLIEDIAKNVSPSDADLQARYEQLKAQQMSGPNNQEFQVRHILVRDEKTANNILQQLKTGKKFADLASKQSLDTGTKQKGGELGWTVPKAAFVPEFANAIVTKGSKGLLPAPVQTQFGFHVVEIQGVRAVQFPNFEQVKEQLRGAVVSEEVQKLQQELRKNATVK